MKLQALIGAVLVAASFSAPAFAAAATTTTTKSSTTTTTTTTDPAAAKLEARIQGAKDLWNEVKGLKQKGKNASAAEFAKVRARVQKLKDGVKEAKAEGHAAKSMVLAAIVAKIEKQIDKLDPSGATKTLVHNSMAATPKP